MGGGYYDRDVGLTSSGGFSFSNYTDSANRVFTGKATADPKVLAVNRRVFCDKASPVVIALDGTGSMGDDAKIIYDKLPMMYGQIMMQNYLKDPAISFSVIGDAYCDNSPIQICDFAQGSDLDMWMSKLWLEGGGGGQSRESYELTAYYYLTCCDLENSERPFMFIIGDENYYPSLERHFVIKHLGFDPECDLDTKDIFKKLSKKFNLYHIHKGAIETSNAQIVKSWKEALDNEHVIFLEEAKAIVDLMLGIIATVSKTRDIDNYLVDMKNRFQDDKRIALVEKTLQALPSNTSAIVKFDDGLNKPSLKSRKTGTKKL